MSIALEDHPTLDLNEIEEYRPLTEEGTGEEVDTDSEGIGDAPVMAQESGELWHLVNGDSCEVLKGLPSDSIDLTLYSPPFVALYTYSSTERDLGNCKSPEQFFEHYSFIAQELLRIMKPGRNVVLHVAQVTTTKAKDGVIGMYDFRGDMIRCMVKIGFIFHGEITVDKNPQPQAIRTHSKGLLFIQKEKDGSWLRPGLADYLLIFRTPGENVVPVKPDITNEDWILWAHPVWYDIKETDTLNVAVARENEDERHVCLSEGSKVLTYEDGYKSIEDVVIGDRVLTHKGRWMPVIARQYTGLRKVVTIRGQGIPGLTLTPDHKLWTRDGRGLPCSSRPKAAKSIPDWMEAQDVVASYVNLKLPEVDESIEGDRCFWWTVGRWIADGYIDKRDVAHLSFPEEKMQVLMEKIDRYGGNPPRWTGTCYQLGLRDPGRTLRNTLERCGEGAANKHLPPEAFRLSVELASCLLDGYLSGDGHFREDRRRWMVTSVSRDLLLGMALLIQRVHGSIASVYAGRTRTVHTISGRTVHCHPEWVMSFDIKDDERRTTPFVLEDGAWKKIRSVEESGEAPTWNLRVAEDESFTAEGCIVKNCPLQLGLIERVIRLWSNPGEIVLDPFNGIASSGVKAVSLGRRYLGVELKPSYYQTSVNNLRQAEWQSKQPGLDFGD